ncbi:disks large homolog 4-like isoform X2 [Chiloscyllium punctatum]|uniref:disks large homolog 4-like isoform X2 n=1 Tax=Chiloscyllium punctatum TaxID=137246 RepID=UPI003B637DA9
MRQTHVWQQRQKLGENWSMASRRRRDMPSMKTESHIIVLKRGNAGFGFNILGGVDKPCYPGNFGIYVAKIRENESAALDGRLREGDKILEAGGVSLVNILHEEAADIFRNVTSDELVLRIERQVGYEFGNEMYSTAEWKPSQLCPLQFRNLENGVTIQEHLTQANCHGSFSQLLS